MFAERVNVCLAITAEKLTVSCFAPFRSPLEPLCLRRGMSTYQPPLPKATNGDSLKEADLEDIRVPATPPPTTQESPGVFLGEPLVRLGSLAQLPPAVPSALPQVDFTSERPTIDSPLSLDSSEAETSPMGFDELLNSYLAEAPLPKPALDSLYQLPADHQSLGSLEMKMGFPLDDMSLPMEPQLDNWLSLP